MAIPRIFDRTAYAMRRARAGRTACDNFLVGDAAQSLLERISAANREFHRALDLGSRLQSRPTLDPLAGTWVRTHASSPDALFHCDSVIADEEALPFADASFDLVVSVLALHAVNDLPGALTQIRRALVPDGLFVAALFGGSTLHELRHAFAAAETDTVGGVTPRVAPFADVRDLGGLLQRAGFALPVADIERITVRYGDFFTLARDLRSLGETNVLTERAHTFLRRATLSSVLAHYSALHTELDGKLRATFEIAYLTGWAPGGS